MKRKALRRASALCIMLISVSLLISGLPVGGAFAFLDGETVNAGSVFAGGWIGPATAASATASGYDTSLAWTPGTQGPVTGQQLYGVDNTTTSNCTGVTYSLLATLASASTATYTDSNRGSTANGDWYCYELLSTSASSWTAATALPAVQLGLVATAISLTNGNGTIANGDTIKITFNQKTTVAAGTVKVCGWAGTGTAGSIVIGDTAAGNCAAAGDAYSIGKITNIAVGTTRTYLTSTAAVSASAPWTVTITLAGSSGSSTESGTAKFTPSTTVKSSATTDQATACTAATTNCQPTTTSTF